MSYQEDLHRLLDLLVAGEIAPAEHEALQSLLKTDAEARATFRQRMDLESGLRHWAAEAAELPSDERGPNGNDVTVSLGGRSDLETFDSRPSSAPSLGKGRTQRGDGKHWSSRQTAFIAVLVASMIFVMAALFSIPNSNEQQIADSQVPASGGKSVAKEALGHLVEQPNCRWQIKPVSWGGTFNSGIAVLQRGAAELRFGSGTNLILQAPCEFKVTDASTAELLAGSVAVHVTEQSNGFVLGTPESEILDEGTEYAVSVAEDSTEVHVFNGSVWWVPKLEDERKEHDLQDRIEAGQAKQYVRSQPTDGKFIPFGRRQFVRNIEQAVRDDTEGEIIAYDGFENLAGRMRRGRSGFGWSGGWIPTGRRGGKAAEILDAPPGTVFGVSRDQRRLMLCSEGSDLRRELSPPFTWEPETELYLSFIIRDAETETRPVPESGDLEGKTPEQSDPRPDRSLRMTLEPDLPGRGRTRHAVASFGITSSGVPFINSRQRVSRTGLSILRGEDYFCVVRIPSVESNRPPQMRVYHSTEAIESDTAETWTVEAEFPVERQAIRWIRVTAGSNAFWHIDELRLGATWQSVIESEQDVDQETPHSTTG
ncbi:FecR domain-containing protein [Roseimaritima ulvae]|uniref:FecR protein n=1 Tax=Roseimaritima ulvae TaxID=980254 RepID=A0A5B9QN98_9BACT|nr:FecR domain-containing protein [Roseimaritima ulvae]QEG39362.1 FecR protein [Roseimaritima ulvae]